VTREGNDDTVDDCKKTNGSGGGGSGNNGGTIFSNGGGDGGGDVALDDPASLHVYATILSWFLDAAAHTAPYSLHNLLAQGAVFGKGESSCK
jgi:hypothetical protein